MFFLLLRQVGLDMYEYAQWYRHHGMHVLLVTMGGYGDSEGWGPPLCQRALPSERLHMATKLFSPLFCEPGRHRSLPLTSMPTRL